MLIIPLREICFYAHFPWPCGHISFGAMRFWYFEIFWQQRYFCSSHNFKYSRYVISVDLWKLRFYFGLIDWSCNCVVGFGFSQNHRMLGDWNGMETNSLSWQEQSKPSVWKFVEVFSDLCFGEEYMVQWDMKKRSNKHQDVCYGIFIKQRRKVNRKVISSLVK